MTRSVQPVINSISIHSMSLGLHNTRIPQKDGSTLCPTQKTIAAMNPTVRACRDAPQIPAASSASDAHTLRTAAIRSQP